MEDNFTIRFRLHRVCGFKANALQILLKYKSSLFQFNNHYLYSKYMSQVKQIGNAIPPVFVTHVMMYIKSIMSGDIIET